MQGQVRAILQNLGLHVQSIDDGEVEITETITFQKYEELKELLIRNDLELVSDRESILTEKIKNVIIEMIHI